MSERRPKLPWVVAGILVVFLLVLFLLADGWLRSDSARELLEVELSASLGSAVRLRGDYRLSVLPRLSIEGQDLEIGLDHQGEVLARTEHYSAMVKILPLFRKQLHVVAVELDNGYISLGLFESKTAAGDELKSGQAGLPKVAWLALSEMVLRARDGAALLRIERLVLEDFQPGKESRIELLAQYPGDDAHTMEIEIQGLLNVDRNLVSVSLALSAMSIVSADDRISGFSGNVRWLLSESAISGRMEWSEKPGAMAGFNLLVGAALSGHVKLDYPLEAGDASLLADVDFALHDDVIELQTLALEFAGQSLEAWGCYRFTPPLGLNLFIRAEVLDIDSLYQLMPESQQGAGSSELPFPLAAELKVDTATYSGSIARSARLSFGGNPDCADIAQIVP